MDILYHVSGKSGKNCLKISNFQFLMNDDELDIGNFLLISPF